MAKIGIVVLNYITWEETLNCVESIRKSDSINEINVYIVDNRSSNSDICGKMLKKTDANLIMNDTNNGYAAGNNIGIRKALEDGCEYILISNNDILFEKGSIDKMFSFLESNENYGIVAPKIYDIAGNIQMGHFIKKTQYKDIWGTQTLMRYFVKRPTESLFGTEEFYKDFHQIYAACGCCFMLSRKCAEKITPLDENTILYEEENIIGARMENIGMKTGYFPDSVVIHKHDQSTRLVKPFASICWACSEIYYCKAYLGVGQLRLLWLYWYRTLVFWGHAVKSKEYRKQWKEYRKKTKKYLNA